MVSVWYCQFFRELEESLQMWGPQVTEEILRETFGTLGCNGDVQQETRDVVGWCRLRAIFIWYVVVFLSELSEEVFPTCSWSISCGPSISSFSNCWCTSQYLTVQTILAQSEEPRYNSNSSRVFPVLSPISMCLKNGKQAFKIKVIWATDGHSNLAEVMRCHREGLGTWTRSEP